MSNSFGEKILDGKVAFVAGGTRGFNLAIAQKYAEHGCKVVVSSRNEERCSTAAQSIIDMGAEAMGIPCDVRDYDALQEVYKHTKEKFGPIDLVVAAQAGNFYAPALGMSMNAYRSIIDIDLIGTFNVFRGAFEHLNRPGASMLAITAPEGVRPLPFQSHVCAAKAGVNMLLKCLAVEWGPAGVRVNGLSPGPIEGSWGMDNVIAKDPEMKETITKAIPLKRWGVDKDIADGALFLASDAASWVTGTILDIDGGVTIASPGSGDTDAVNFAGNEKVRGPGKGDR